MRRVHFLTGVKDSLVSLRTFFYGLLLLLLPLYNVSEMGAASNSGRYLSSQQHSNEHSKHTAGMGAPPPPLLESHPRLATFGTPERRLLGVLPAAVYLGIVSQSWNAALPLSAPNAAAHTDLAMFQQWRLEGG